MSIYYIMLNHDFYGQIVSNIPNVQHSKQVVFQRER
jgi:hypothetical protein